MNPNTLIYPKIQIYFCRKIELINIDDELDELRRKQLAEIAELQNEIDVVNARLQSMEKQRARLSAETDSARADADALAQQAHQLEKRQRAHEKQVANIQNWG